MNRLSAALVGITVAGAVVVAALHTSSPSAPQCARAPSDGGHCFVRLPDGRRSAIGGRSAKVSSWSRAEAVEGECELFPCPPDP